MTEAPVPVAQQHVLERIPALDGLRGLAVLLVLAIHTVLVTGSSRANVVDNGLNLLVRSFGPLGVDAFFALSGFLITSILDSTRNSTHPFRTFYVRRVLRIAPLYYVYLLLIPVLFASWGAIAVGTPESRAWDWIFLTNVEMTQYRTDQIGFFFGHLWSLAIEEHFYLIWPLVVLLIPRRRLPAVCVVVLGFSATLRIFLVTRGLAHYGWLLMPSRMDGIAAGSLVALLRVMHPEELDAWAKRYVRPAMLLVLPLFVLGLTRLFWHVHGPVTALSENVNLGRRVEVALTPFVGGCVFATAIAYLSGDPRRGGLLHSRFLRRVGVSSYGMYLFHVPFVILLFLLPKKLQLFGLDAPFQIAAYIFVVSLSFIAGASTWHFFESRIVRMAPAYHYSDSET